MPAVTTYSGAVFHDGAAARLLELAAACRRDPSRTLEDEITRFCRTVRESPQADWAMPLPAVAALLDLISKEVERVDAATLSAGFAALLAEAAGDTPAPALLRRLSAALRLRDRRPTADYERLPMAPWEAELKFGRIHRLWWWMESGEYEDFDEGVRAGVASEHPHGCRTALAALGAELQEALLLGGAAATAPWASPPVLRAILGAVHAHVEEEH